MGIVVLLVVGLAILMGFVMMPTIVEITDLFTAAAGTPLAAIISLMPFAFLGLIIIGCLWVVNKRM